ncbi:glutaminase [Corynebacterium liangguodongii]|uniref:Glutaminase n=1 Tax=Corynebacterium liangguodongii TaxID=2079535 RepID=A0A2S0WBH8_9CORY|nr:glutaminase [Corynebacterium liangguodongii]AWB83113.1 glutaminase [Corynebacterium liangguodongii]PWB99286.1 glutaminase [Corynebacterium liangguodongii]
MPTPVPEYLEQLLESVRDDTSGAVADYIEALRQADPDKLGLALCTTSGHLYSVGDDDYEFSIQSISKPFAYALALEENGPRAVHKVVGVEPSGDAFNAISLDSETNRPSNPMINAGALAVNQLINGSNSSVEDRVEKIRAFFSELAGRELSIDEAIVDNELSSAHRNLAIAHLLCEFGMVQDSPEDAVNSYTQQCAIQVTVKDLAVMAATLAGGGVQPVTGKRVVSAEAARVTQAVMTSAGMYDGSGRWMVNVGIPAKSGVSGGLIGTMPGQLGIASLSPRLNDRGNSVRGVKLFRELSSALGLNLMGSDYYLAPGIKSVTRKGSANVVALQGMINFTAVEKILYELAERNLSQRDLVLDVSHVTAFNKAGRLLIKEGIRHIRDQGVSVSIYDPDSALPDYEFSDGTRFEAVKDFTHSFTIDAPREQVFDAICRPDQWWNEEIEGAEGAAGEPGGGFRVDTEDSCAEVTVAEAVQGDRLVWRIEPTGDEREDSEWSDTDIVFDLEEGESGSTRVKFTHRGMHEGEEGYESFAEEWRRRLKDKLEPLIKRG